MSAARLARKSLFFIQLLFLVAVFSVTSLSWAGSMQFGSENYFSIRSKPFSATQINPGNRILKLSDFDSGVDLRPELKWLTTYEQMSEQKIVLRPRWTFLVEKKNFSTPDESVTVAEGRLQLSDFYIEDIWTDHFKTTLGLQVYQWGPAELLNPSNPLFHFNSHQKSAFFKEKGQVLLRANIDYDRNWSQVVLLEPISNNESPWLASRDNSDDSFVPKGLVKTEWQSGQGSHNAGFVFGREELSKNFIGEYFVYSPVEGYSIYGDAKQNEGSLAFSPVSNNYGSDTLIYNSSTSWTQLAIFGARFESSKFDLRLEYIDNQAGWDRSQFGRVIKSLKQINPDLGKNINRFAKPGLELLGQHYYYFSARIPNIGKKEDKNIYLRYLLSDLDGSSALQAGADWNMTDSMTSYLEAEMALGSTESDLNLVGQNTYLLGLKWNL